MSWRDELTTRLAPLTLRPEREAEILEELSQHLDDAVRDFVAAGASPDAARRAALADLDAPGVLASRLASIETRAPAALPPPGGPAGGSWIRALLTDLRYSLRTLRRAPAFALAVVATLALTIGPTTAILSLGNWLIWRPPAGVVQPDRLAVVWFGEFRDTGGVSPRRISTVNIEELRAAARTIAAIAGWQEGTSSLAVPEAPPRRVGTAHANAGFLDLLGVRPIAGRSFTAQDDRPPFGSPVVIVSHDLARQAFGGPELAVGQTLTLNGRRMSIVGVLPAGFAGARPFSQVDVWFPSLTYYYANHFSAAAIESRQGRGSSGVFYTFVVRLAPGATFDALQAELDGVLPTLADRYPQDNRALRAAQARVYPGLGPDELARDRYAALVRTLLIVGAVLLLLGCANVANLLISRGLRRGAEHRVRAALGASAWRLGQLVLVESCVLALSGAALGVALAAWLTRVLQTLLPGAAGADALFDVPIDGRVLVATLAVSLACGILAGLAPAFIAAVGPGQRTLGRSNTRTVTAGGRLRTGLAVVQLALSIALVTNAFLLLATLRSLAAVDTGFDPSGVSVHFLNLNSHGYSPDRALGYDRDLLERLTAEPALEHASLSGWTPPGGLGTWIGDPGGESSARIDVRENHVTDTFFHTAGIRLLAGRTFTRAESVRRLASRDGTPVILSQTLARRLYGDANPLGRSVPVPATRSEAAYELTVIGVAPDLSTPLGGQDDPEMYTPFAHGLVWATRPVLLVRSERPLRDVAGIVQSHATALDAAVPLSPPQRLADVNGRALASRRVFALMLSLLGGLGLTLASVGLYGLLAQMIVERTREFGIRLAIGGDAAHVRGLVLRRAGWIALVGGAFGLGLAYTGSQVIASQLVGVTRLDPRVYSLALAMLTLVVLAASLWPARSAARIQPVEAMRTE